MPARRKRRSSNGFTDGPVTRSKSETAPVKNADITYYTTIQDPMGQKDVSGSGFRVVSKQQLKSDPGNIMRLETSLSKVREWEEKKKTDSIEAIEPAFNQKLVYLVTHLNIFIYATCFFIQSGTLPYLTKKLGADPVVFGHLQTAAAVAQLMGGPIYGRLGDVAGDRVTLILAFCSAAISYFLMGVATSVRLLFLSMSFTVLLHAMQGSQMILTALSTEEQRTAALAKLGFSYGLGMVVGPALGGAVTKHYGEQMSALVAAAGSVFSALLVIVFIPHISKKSSVAGGYVSSNSMLSVFNVKAILGLLFVPGVFRLLLLKFVCGIPIGILQSMFSVIAIEQFGLDADLTGMVLSYVGAVSFGMQGFGIGAATSRFSDKAILKFSTLTLTLAYFILILVQDLQDFMLVLLPLTISMCLINSVLTSSLTKKVKESTSGQILGLNMAMHSAIRSVAPSVGGFLVSAYGVTSLGAVGMASNIVALALIPFVKLKVQ